MSLLCIHQHGDRTHSGECHKSEPDRCLVVCQFCLSDAEALSVSVFEGETKSWTRKIGGNLTVMRLGGSVEQHVLDAHMVVEPFEVTQPRRGAGGMKMQGRGAMSRQIDVLRLAQCRDLRKARNAAATRHIGLQHIDRREREQPTEVVEIVAVLSGGDIELINGELGGAGFRVLLPRS